MTCEATEERRGRGRADRKEENNRDEEELMKRSVFTSVSHPTSSSVYHLWITSSTMRRVCVSFVSGVTIAAVMLMLSWQRKLKADHHVVLRLSVQVRLIQTSLRWQFDTSALSLLCKALWVMESSDSFLHINFFLNTTMGWFFSYAKLVHLLCAELLWKIITIIHQTEIK